MSPAAAPSRPPREPRKPAAGEADPLLDCAAPKSSRSQRSCSGEAARPAQARAPTWLDPPEVKVPRGGKRWAPDERASHGAALKREARGLLLRKPIANDFSGWQMPFPFEMGSGADCPICTLGECGDEKCPSYRPTRPEVRAAFEDIVVQRCLERFVDGPGSLDTYVSVGCGLLAQDFVLLEKIQRAAAELRPCRAIFVDLWTSSVAVACEGFTSYEASKGANLDLRQFGFNELLGPEFSFSAYVCFEPNDIEGSRIFDFCNGASMDNIYVEVEESFEFEDERPSGNLVFGVRRQSHLRSVTVEGGWVAGATVHYLFTVSATGVLRIYIGGELCATGQAHTPRPVQRRHLYVGRSSEEPNRVFQGQILKVKVWDTCIDMANCESCFAGEMERALTQFSQWYAEDLTVWSFGSLGTYVAAVQQDPRFAADLLMRIDVHEAIDGYDDFVPQVLSPHGLALTLGGEGKSWERLDSEVRELRVHCAAYQAAKALLDKPRPHFGPCGCFRHHHECSEAHSGARPRWPARRPAKAAPPRRRPRRPRRARDA